jgi:hypothetical protein
MTNRALEISGAKAPCGWNFSIRTYNIVSSGTAVMEYAARGDVSHIQQLLSEGKASLLDRTYNGISILDVRIISINTISRRVSIPTNPRSQLRMEASKLSSFCSVKAQMLLRNPNMCSLLGMFTL